MDFVRLSFHLYKVRRRLMVEGNPVDTMTCLQNNLGILKVEWPANFRLQGLFLRRTRRIESWIVSLDGHGGGGYPGTRLWSHCYIVKG